MRNRFFSNVTGVALGSLALAVLAFSPTLSRASEGPQIVKNDWKFDGIFGSFDRASLQRGFQVYSEVCAACHALRLVKYRDLADLGYDEDTIKGIAAENEVTDGPNDLGEMYQRPAQPSDAFVPPFANPQTARLGNNGALPPDLSLITKARKNGPDYIYALMTGYVDEPVGFTLSDGMYYNAVFPGHQIAMPSPLAEDSVEFSDGTAATVEQMSKDLVMFLTWTAEPELEDRKRMGIKVMLFLFVLTILLLAVKRKIWAKLH